MIGSSLPGATFSSWVALDSSLTFQAFGGWILRNLSLLCMKIDRTRFDDAT